MRKQIIWAFMILLAVSLVSSCKKDSETPGEASIISFKIGDVTATINETAKTITAELAPGLDVTTLQPVIMVSEGATITPASGATTDFTNPVTYTVKDKTGTVTNSYVVTVTSATLRKIAFIGAAATNTDAAWAALSGTDYDLMDDKTAANWCVNSMASSTTQVTYLSFEDAAAANDLNKYHAIWIQFDGGWWGGEVAQFPVNTNGNCLLRGTEPISNVDCPDLAANFIAKIKGYYEAGGNLFLGNYAGSMVDELGVVSKAEYAPNNSWGGPTVDDGATASAWNVRWAADPTSPLFAGISLTTDPGIQAPAFTMVESGALKKNRSDQYSLNFGPWAPNGDADPLATRTASFLSMTGCKILIENGGENEGQMVMWDASGSKGAVIAALGGTYDWYVGDPVTNGDRNIKTLTKNCLNYLVDQALSKKK
ncbi:MAG: DUF4960 domain-containing protein [Bacteroidetes bacterium]|nr:DUF4960 domain-containing protein [Bacteroidota bacterium]